LTQKNFKETTSSERERVRKNNLNKQLYAKNGKTSRNKKNKFSRSEPRGSSDKHIPEEKARRVESGREIERGMGVAFGGRSFAEVAYYAQARMRSFQGVSGAGCLVEDNEGKSMTTVKHVTD